MKNIYEVMIYDGNVEHLHYIYGLKSAVRFCIEYGLCDNVVAAHVKDIETSEIMWHIENGIVVWISGFGNIFEF